MKVVQAILGTLSLAAGFSFRQLLTPMAGIERVKVRNIRIWLDNRNIFRQNLA